jgi:hypothetical protein
VQGYYNALAKSYMILLILWQPAKRAQADYIIENMHEDGSDTHELANGGPLFFESCNNSYMVRFEKVRMFRFNLRKILNFVI